MSTIDPKVKKYMSELGKKRWLNSTPEQRKRQGELLALGRKKKKEKLSTDKSST